MPPTAPPLAGLLAESRHLRTSAAKAERLRQAKTEAEREIADFKAEREAEFKRKVADDSTSSQENVAALAAESERAVAAIKDSIAAKKEAVLKMLLDEVKTVRPPS